MSFMMYQRMKLKLLTWTEPLRRFIMRERSIQIPAKLAETATMIFLLSSATLTYLYGTFLVFPEVLAGCSSIVMIFSKIVTTWIYIAICANFYLVRKRNSSIRNRMLLQPVVKPMSPNVAQMDSEVQLRETAKHMGEHFKLNPFGEGYNWHICASCEVFVPPRCWHCNACNTCILRRDHHCIFTGCCIGEENQGNFMGLLFYLGCGTTIAAIFSYVYYVYFKEMVFWWYCLRLVGMLYTLCFDFSIMYILASLNTVGQMAAWGVFIFYVFIALRSQTSADAHRKITRTLPGESRYSLKNMAAFLGPYPILRILWPFHPPLKIDYSNNLNYSFQPTTDNDRYRQSTTNSDYPTIPTTNSSSVLELRFDYDNKDPYCPHYGT